MQAVPGRTVVFFVRQQYEMNLFFRRRSGQRPGSEGENAPESGCRCHRPALSQEPSPGIDLADHFLRLPFAPAKDILPPFPSFNQAPNFRICIPGDLWKRIWRKGCLFRKLNYNFNKSKLTSSQCNSRELESW
jgi:hypothetical protein